MKFQQNGTGPIVNIVMSEIRYAIDGPKDTVKYLNKNTGEVVGEIIFDDESYVKIPKFRSHHREMINFIDTIPPGKQKDDLTGIIDGRGCFKKFRELTRNSGSWQIYRRNAQVGRAMRFLSRIGFEKV